MTVTAPSTARMPRPLGRPRIRMMAALVLVGLGQTVCVVAFALLAHMMTRLVGHPDRPGTGGGGIYAPLQGTSATVLFTGIGVTAVVAVALRAAFLPLAERLAQSYVHSVRMRLFDQVAGSVVWGVRRRTVGVTVLRFTGDSSALRMWVSRGVASLLTDGVFVLCTVGALAVFSPAAGAVTGGLLLTGTGIVALLGRSLRKQLRATRRCNGRVAAFVNERVTYAAVMQSLGRVGRERRVLRRRSKEYGAAKVREARLIGAVTSVAEGCRTGTYLAVIGIGVCSDARATTLAALLPLVGFIGGPLLALARAQVYWQSFSVARDRITEVLGEPAQLRAPRTAPPLTEGPGRLELAGLRKEGTLEDVSVAAEPGRRIVVTGPPGAGKTLLLSLIARLQVPDDGTVLLDGEDISQHDPESVRRAIRLVSPELPLLRGSVEENLKHGVPDGQSPPPEAGAREEALASLLPQGLTTRVGEGGNGLPAAVRYQVALARALRSMPRILLLDDVSLEQLSGPEDSVRLLGWHPGTVVYVSRDPRLIARADTVWRVEDGRVTVEKRAGASADGPDGAVDSKIIKKLTDTTSGEDPMGQPAAN